MSDEVTYVFDNDEKGRLRLLAPFKREELCCRCGCGKSPHVELIRKLVCLRMMVGPLLINSGARCPTRNQLVGGEADSLHMQGRAVDIACADPIRRAVILAAALQLGFVGIGLRDGLIHLDIGREDGTGYGRRVFLYKK